MRRYVIAVLLSVLLLLGGASAAEMTEYTIEELDMSISIPDEYIVFTRQISEDDPNLSRCKMTAEEMWTFMTDNNIYLEALGGSLTKEIVVAMEDGVEKDFDQCDDDELKRAAELMKAEFLSIGGEDVRINIYRNEQAAFLRCEWSTQVDGIELHILQCITVRGGQMISVALKSYAEEITGEGHLVLRSVVDSVEFGAQRQQMPEETPVNTEAEVDTEYTQEDRSAYFALELVISFVLTVAFYCLPIFIYRYAIRKEPVPKAKAKKITIIYGVAAFFVMTALVLLLGGNEAASATAAVLWSCVNYRVLKGGKEVSTEAPDVRHDKPCPNCGRVNPEGSSYCGYCGFQLKKNEPIE